MNKKILIIIIAVIIVIIGAIFVLGSSQPNNENNNLIQINNLTENIALDNNYYIGDVKGQLIVNEDIDYLYVIITYYNESNTQLGQGYIMLSEADVKKGQKFNLENQYYDTPKPTLAKIKVYDDMGNNLISEKEIKIKT